MDSFTSYHQLLSLKLCDLAHSYYLSLPGTPYCSLAYPMTRPEPLRLLDSYSYLPDSQASQADCKDVYKPAQLTVGP